MAVVWLLRIVPVMFEPRHHSELINKFLVQVRMLSEAGVKEVTLLGQNVNSYADWSMAEGGVASSKPPGAVPTDAAAAVYAQVRAATACAFNVAVAPSCHASP